MWSHGVRITEGGSSPEPANRLSSDRKGEEVTLSADGLPDRLSFSG
jgi:hypothetical protein